MIKVKNLFTIAIISVVALTFTSCNKQDVNNVKGKIGQVLQAGDSIGTVQAADDALPTENEVANKMRQSDRIYVTEYAVQKIVTADDVSKLKVGAMSFKTSIGSRRVAIPMEAILKAYIDFDSLSASDITLSKEPRKIAIKLTAPKVELTSSKINHKEINEYTDILRSSFSDRELTDFENQGRKAILASIPNLGIMRRAEQNARDVLVPMFMQFGFDSKEIEIEFKN